MDITQALLRMSRNTGIPHKRLPCNNFWIHLRNFPWTEYAPIPSAMVSESLPLGFTLPVSTSATAFPPSCPPCQTYITACGAYFFTQLISMMFPVFRSTAVHRLFSVTFLIRLSSSSVRSQLPRLICIIFIFTCGPSNDHQRDVAISGNFKHFFRNGHSLSETTALFPIRFPGHKGVLRSMPYRFPPTGRLLRSYLPFSAHPEC